MEKKIIKKKATKKEVYIGDVLNPEPKSISVNVDFRTHLTAIIVQGMLSNPKASKYKSNIFQRIHQMFFPKSNIYLQFSNTEDVVSDAVRYADEIIKINM